MSIINYLEKIISSIKIHLLQEIGSVKRAILAQNVNNCEVS